MKRNVNRLLSLALALVMLVGILPLSAKPVEVEAAGEEYNFDEVIMYDGFENASVSAFSAAGTAQRLTSDGFANQELPTRTVVSESASSDGVWSLSEDEVQGNVIKLVKTATDGKTATKLYSQAKARPIAVVGEWYRLTWKAKVEDGSGKACVYLRGCWANGGEGVASNTSIAATQWQEYSMEFRASSAVQFQIWFGFEGVNVGTAYFDDFKIEKIVEDPVPVADDSVAFCADFSTADDFGGWSKGTNSSQFSFDANAGAVKMTYGTGTSYTQKIVPARILAGNTYRYEIWLSSSIGSPYFYVGGSVSGGSWVGGSASLIKETRREGKWIVYTLQHTPTQNAEYLRMLIGFSSGTQGETCYFKKVQVTENWSIDNAIAYGQQLKLMADTECDVELGATGYLNLNGYKLTANFVNGADGSQIIDSSTDKSGRIDADVVSLSPNNPDLPVMDADGNYALADVNLGSAYLQQLNATENGFTIVFRPGFGTKDIVNMVASGNSGVSMSLNISWTDVFGHTPDEPTVIEGFDDIVQSAYSGGKAIYAWFTNPGDTYKFTMQVAVESLATGVVVKSDVAADADATYINPAEKAKTYLFVNNFNDEILISGTGNIQSSIGDKYLKVSHVRPSFNGSYMLLDGGASANQLDLPFHFDDVSTLVMEMDLRYVDTTGLSNSGKSAFDLLVLRNSTTTDTFKRYTPLYVGGSPRLLCFREYKNQVSVNDSTPITNGADLSVYEQKTRFITNEDGKWTHIKLTINYRDKVMIFEVDGVVLGTTPYIPLNSTGWAYMARYASYDSIAIDNMKIYYTTPAAN